MQTSHSPFPLPGTDLGHLDIEVSREANERYWAGAGVDHPARNAGLLYPPMVVNFAILLVQQTVREGLLHTWGRLRCHRSVAAPASLVVTGKVRERFEKRERDYFTVSSEVRTADGDLVWSADLELADSRRRPGAGDTGAPGRPAYTLPGGTEPAVRSMTLTADRLRTYSRAGNFHSDDTAAREMGLPGMVAMGMQTLGPACSLLLDERGVACLEHAEIEARFFGLVLEGDTVEASVCGVDGHARFVIRNLTKGVTTAAGEVRLGG
ncbi:MAG TPA: MaoC family dehydratase [Acidimicrobiia bacterium]|nr:MaoC family dehydratase [Acidimicrobiia bacterium]